MTNTESTAAPTDPQALADSVAQAMWSRDTATQALGMSHRLGVAGPGHPCHDLCGPTWSTATTSATAA
jgi:hypothetical protein